MAEDGAVAEGGEEEEGAVDRQGDDVTLATTSMIRHTHTLTMCHVIFRHVI